MSFSAGTYSLPGPALNTGDTVSATENNTFRNDVATAFNLTWLRDGSAAATANIPMGGFQFTNCAAVGSNGSLLLKSNNGTTAVTIDTAQNMGLGVTPSAWNLGKAIEVGALGNALWGATSTQVNMTQNAYYQSGFKYASTNAASYYSQIAGSHIWYNAPSGTAGNAITFTQAMTLDASGNLLVGSTSANYSAAGRANVEINGATTSLLALTYNGSTTNSSYIYNTSLSLEIAATGSRYLKFSTNGAEAGRFDSSGNLLVGTTSTAAFIDTKFWLSGDSGTTKWGVGPRAALGTAFYVVGQTGSAGVYLPTTAATAWSSASDERLKTEIVPFENAAQKVCSLRAGTGRYLTDDETMSRSFLIAQDVQKVLPEAVNVQPDEMGTLGLAYTEVIPLLVAAIQEQQQIITDLTNRITALEGAK